jgi:hypothetical protein
MLKIKRAHTELLRDEVFSLRYRAYRKESAIAESVTESFKDEFDDQSNHVLWALTDEEKVVGSIRTMWYEPSAPGIIPEMKSYADDISKVVPDNMRLVSGNRFVIDPDRSDHNARYAMVLLRYYMVVAQLRCDWSVCAVRVNHVPFYRRIMRLERASEARIYPGLTSFMHLMVCDFQKNIGSVYETSPLLRPHGYERIFLDENYRDVWEIGLPLE